MPKTCKSSNSKFDIQILCKHYAFNCAQKFCIDYVTSRCVVVLKVTTGLLIAVVLLDRQLSQTAMAPRRPRKKRRVNEFSYDDVESFDYDLLTSIGEARIVDDVDHRGVSSLQRSQSPSSVPRSHQHHLSTGDEARIFGDGDDGSSSFMVDYSDLLDGCEAPGDGDESDDDNAHETFGASPDAMQEEDDGAPDAVEQKVSCLSVRRVGSFGDVNRAA